MRKIKLLSLAFIAIVAIGFVLKRSSGVNPSNFISKKDSSPNTCLTSDVYEDIADPNAPVLSLPFDPDDYSTKYWGMVPFCAKLRNGQIHGAFDYELKPNTSIFAAADGIVTKTEVGQAEGSGEILSIKGTNFTLDYSGLKNITVSPGETVKKGQYVAQAVRIPHGEHHLHIGLNYNGKQQCLLKYMDEEFLEATKEMFAKADYESQTNAECLCDCESLDPGY